MLASPAQGLPAAGRRARARLRTIRGQARARDGRGGVRGRAAPRTGAPRADYADVLLPIAPFTETSGTFVNTEGRVQSFNGVVKPLGEARPAWKVLRVLGNLLGLAGFDYDTQRAGARRGVPGRGDVAGAARRTRSTGCRSTADGAPRAGSSGSPTCRSTSPIRSCAARRRCRRRATRAPPRACAERRAARAARAARGRPGARAAGRRRSACSRSRVDDAAAGGLRALAAAHPATAQLGRDVRRRSAVECEQAHGDRGASSTTSLGLLQTLGLRAGRWGPPVWTLVKTLVLIIVIVAAADRSAWPTSRSPSARSSARCRCASARTASGRSGCCSRSPTRVKLLFKEIIIPTGREQVPVRARADAGADAGAGGLGGDSVQPGAWCWPTSTPACST